MRFFLIAGLVLSSAVLICSTVVAQNVGIGTNDPKRKLHVAGGIRIDTLSGPNGIVTKDVNGDLSSVAFTANSSHVLKGDGSFGVLDGLTPSSGVLTSKIYNNTTLINAGYSLIGEIPGVSTYATASSTFPLNTWQPAYTRGIPGNVSAPAQVDQNGFPKTAGWNESLLYVFDDQTYTYNPDTDVWAIANGLGFSPGSTVIWTGTEFLLLDFNFSSVRKYNPGTNIWSNISAVNKPSSRNYYSAVWDGTRLIVWGGAFIGTPVNTGGIYNPATDTWTVMSTSGAPLARQKHTAVWNTATNRMIVWGGSTNTFSGEMNTGGLFDPASNTWTGATSTTNPPGIRNDHTAVWTGTEMIIFGGRFNAGVNLNSGGKYNPVTNTWVATGTTGSPSVSMHAAAWSGTQMYISGGLYAGSPGSPEFYMYDPALDAWTFMALFSEGKFQHDVFYKSNMVVVWGGLKENVSGGPGSNTGFRYFLANTASSATTITSETLYLYQKN